MVQIGLITSYLAIPFNFLFQVLPQENIRFQNNKKFGYVFTLVLKCILNEKNIKRIIYSINSLDMINVDSLNIRVFKQYNIKYEENYYTDKFEIIFCKRKNLRREVRNI